MFRRFFQRKKPAKEQERSGIPCGILVFENTSEVIRAEKLIKEQGFSIKVKGPPPQIRTGCDLVIEFQLIEQLNIKRLLEENKVDVEKILPVKDYLLKPVDLYSIKDYGDYLMVRAANMKITIDKASRTVVNISGGGCPDVPFLAREVIGTKLGHGPSPRELGHTLCGYTLELAYEEMKRQCSQ